jgi:hypothetical protein
LRDRGNILMIRSFAQTMLSDDMDHRPRWDDSLKTNDNSEKSRQMPMHNSLTGKTKEAQV